MSHVIEQVAQWVAHSQHLVAFTGAGISTDSGIPDFRGPDGVWTRRDQGLPPPKPKIPRSQWKPNAAHYALVELERLGILKFLISQNTDGLHLEAGTSPDRIAELHGNGRWLKCIDCDHRLTYVAAGWDRRKLGPGYRTRQPRPGQPVCPECGGRLISSVVNFGDPMPEREMDESYAHCEKADVLLAIGSSLVVSPANDLPELAQRNGAKFVLVNLGDTPFDDSCDLRIRQPIGDVIPPMVERVKQILAERG